MTNELIQQVKKINRQAALFMVKKVPLLVQRGKLHSTWEDEKHLRRLPEYCHLPDTFTFNCTPRAFAIGTKSLMNSPLPTDGKP